MLRNLSVLREEAGAGGSAGSSGAVSGTLLAQAAGAAGAAGGAAGSAAGGAAGASGGPVVSKPWREGWIGADGKIDKTAYERLPDHLKPYKATFEKYTTDEAMLQALGHSESLNGRKGLLPLPPTASDADKAEFRKRLGEVLGVPEKPEGYGLKKPDGVPDERWNPKYVEGVAAIAHKHAISPAAMKELFEFDQAQAGEIYSQAEAAKAKAEADAVNGLRSELGAKFEETTRAAARAAMTLGLDINDPVIGSHPGVIKALAKVAGMVGEDRLVTGGQAGAGPTPTERIQSIMSQPSDPLYAAYRNPNDPRHGEATALMLKLHEQELALKTAGR